MVSATEDGLGKLSRQKLLDIFKRSGENYHVFSNYRGMEHFNINGQQEQHLVRLFCYSSVGTSKPESRLSGYYYTLQWVTSFGVGLSDRFCHFIVKYKIFIFVVEEKLDLIFVWILRNVEWLLPLIRVSINLIAGTWNLDKLLGKA